MNNLIRAWFYFVTRKSAKKLFNLGSIVISKAIAFPDDKIIFTTQGINKTSVMVEEEGVPKELFYTPSTSTGILEKINNGTFVFANKYIVCVCWLSGNNEYKRHDTGIKDAKFVRMVAFNELIVVTSSEIWQIYIDAKFSVKIKRNPIVLYGCMLDVFVSPDKKVFIRHGGWSKISCFKKNKKGNYVKTNTESFLSTQNLFYARLGDKFAILDSAYIRICSVINSQGLIGVESRFENNGSMKFNSIVSFDTSEEFYVCMSDNYESVVKKYAIKNGKVKIVKVVAIFNSPNCRIIRGQNYSLIVLDANTVSKIKL